MGKKTRETGGKPVKKSIVAFSTMAMLSSAFVSPAFASSYTVKSGDSLSTIAKKNNMTVKELKLLNNLESDLIKVNQKLITSKADSKATTKSVSMKKTKSQTYTIAAGDTLTKIANKFNLTLGELKNLNNLKSDKIYAGSTLIVSKSTTTTTVDFPAAVKKATTAPAKTITDTYIVQKGDTLSKIAKNANITVAQLKSANSLTSDLIKVGQKLKLTPSAKSASTDKASNKETVSNSSSVTQVISEAKSLIGTPYSWAGASPAGFDCSGFIYYVYKKAGYSISRVTAATYFDMGKKVSSPSAGDLIFFATGSNKAVVSHMGIYIGNGQFIHASSSKGIEINSVSNSYYKTRVLGYRSL